MSDDQDIFGGYQDRFRPRTTTASRPPAPAPDDPPAASRFNPSHSRTPPMLDFRSKNGDSFAISYSFLVAVGFDKSAITLEFSGYRVTLEGVRLGDIYRGLIAHQVASVQECDELASRATGDPKAPAIYRIARECLRT